MTKNQPPIDSKVTIKDVARAAGVAVVSVSRALNEQPGVSEATRQHVREVAERLGYQANRHARMLKLSSTRSLAVMMKGIDNPFFHQMLEIMETKAREHDYLLTVVKVPHHGDEFEDAVQLVREDAVDGIIFLGGNFTHDAAALNRLPVPFVLVTIRHPSGEGADRISSVAVDDFAEAKRAVDYLIELGHERIALIGVDDTDESVGNLRERGYRTALEEAGIEVDPALDKAVDVEAPYTFSYGYDLAKELLVEHPDVTAIFAVADVMAIGALKAAHDLGLRVPDDLSIVGFDGIPVGEFVEPSLTTLVQPAQEIARLTCEILFDTMAGGSPRRELLAGELRVGGTTAPPSGAS